MSSPDMKMASSYYGLNGTLLEMCTSNFSATGRARNHFATLVLMIFALTTVICSERECKGNCTAVPGSVEVNGDARQGELFESY